MKKEMLESFFLKTVLMDTEIGNHEAVTFTNFLTVKNDTEYQMEGKLLLGSPEDSCDSILYSTNVTLDEESLTFVTTCCYQFMIEDQLETSYTSDQIDSFILEETCDKEYLIHYYNEKPYGLIEVPRFFHWNMDVLLKEKKLTPKEIEMIEKNYTPEFLNEKNELLYQKKS